jgi:hypothetical protein
MRRQGQLTIDEVIGMNAGREGTPGRKLTPRSIRVAARPPDHSMRSVSRFQQ